jgi:hypothetical protein
MKEQLEALKKKCNLRQAKCCKTCCFFDTYEEDFGANYQQYCTNPNNEDTTAKSGEDAHFEVADTDVCDVWQGKESNVNSLSDNVSIETEKHNPEDSERNCDRFNSGDARIDFEHALRTYSVETGNIVFNALPQFTSVGDFIIWLLSERILPEEEGK